MTLNGVMAVILLCFAEFGSFWADYVTVVEDRPTQSATGMYYKESTFYRYIIYGDIRRGYQERAHYS